METTTKRPAWWPTEASKAHADAACAHPDVCHIDTADVIGARILDERQAHDLPTGRVTVTCPDGVTDAELAEVAGFCPRHYGWNVTRYDDGTAVVHLWND